MPAIRFNPTATAILYDGTKVSQNDITEMLTAHGLKDKQPAAVQEGSYVVAFMGKVKVLTADEFAAAQGLV